jgi:hypothetical protein
MVGWDTFWVRAGVGAAGGGAALVATAGAENTLSDSRCIRPVRELSWRTIGLRRCSTSCHTAFVMWWAVAIAGSGSAVGVRSEGAGPSSSSLPPKRAVKGFVFRGMSGAGVKWEGRRAKSGAGWRVGSEPR